MLARVSSCALIGLDVIPVDIEVDVSPGQSNFIIVGLADAAIQEAKERLRAAMKNANLRFPWDKRVVINLAPADLKKEGTHFDLAMLIGLLHATQDISFSDKQFCIGEVALDGRIRPVNGMLPITWYAKHAGFTDVFVPQENANQAAVIEGLSVYGVPSLQSLVLHLQGAQPLTISKKQAIVSSYEEQEHLDFKHIKGQEQAKRALVIAAAGGHNMLMSGSPGSGKTLLAKAMSSILPPLTVEECLEVSAIYSIAGLLPENKAYMSHRPFRAPHHSASAVALVGGGRIPKPGEITLAHRGVLFLDEFPEFPRAVLETLRQPIEDGVVSISRSQGHCQFPARFTLVAAQNPCPCGYLHDQDISCVCTPGTIEKYRRKVSGPILDRIDLQVHVPRVPIKDLDSKEEAKGSFDVREEVIRVRNKQADRYQQSGWSLNSELPSSFVADFCPLEQTAKQLLHQAVERLHVSARGYYRLIKVARTIADLAGENTLSQAHVAEALQYRFTES
ncbi:MAG: YifB family Mg chelatase-like AAA ATPase [Candidatus Jacksonbacteria bacterium]|nr:YifB family Mg chelatase-like AAA ATPase [Candidatus Jacksonbacteria bacterium]MBT6954902.1 YifB family Mg chelatase-like AAA ATPase [Candidatus Jacksonbacteria bacterium]MBT7007904.1 YifB family Mg chelatase-like AAA ATPase [Candidatus Jacksonbacteria bacterium]MBT7339412.1 YifB family Mg chelatase-like AAA ATPase [Candidatus Jacksonbacteria bacterium]